MPWTSCPDCRRTYDPAGSAGACPFCARHPGNPYPFYALPSWNNHRYPPVVYAVWAAVSLVLFIILTWPQGEHPEKPRTQPSTDAEELVKRITLRNVRDPEAVTFLAWGPNMCHTEWNARAEEGGVAEGWKGKFDAIVRVRFQEPATADLEGRAAAPSSSKAARAEECDLLVAVKDNVVVGHCPNPFGDNWKKDTLAVLPQLFPATNP